MVPNALPTLLTRKPRTPANQDLHQAGPLALRHRIHPLCKHLTQEAIGVTSVEALSDSLVGEIFKALGLAENGWARRRFGGVFRKAADRLSRVGVMFD